MFKQAKNLCLLDELFHWHVLSNSGHSPWQLQDLYNILNTFLNSVPEIWYRVVLFSLLWVTLMTSHLLGLNFTCQRSAHRSRAVRSDFSGAPREARAWAEPRSLVNLSCKRVVRVLSPLASNSCGGSHLVIMWPYTDRRPTVRPHHRTTNVYSHTFSWFGSPREN